VSRGGRLFPPPLLPSRLGSASAFVTPRPSPSVQRGLGWAGPSGLPLSWAGPPRISSPRWPTSVVGKCPHGRGSQGSRDPGITTPIYIGNYPGAVVAGMSGPISCPPRVRVAKAGLRPLRRVRPRGAHGAYGALYNWLVRPEAGSPAIGLSRRP
jgi:hypothetical protein